MLRKCEVCGARAWLKDASYDAKTRRAFREFVCANGHKVVDEHEDTKEPGEKSGGDLENLRRLNRLLTDLEGGEESEDEPD